MKFLASILPAALLFVVDAKEKTTNLRGLQANTNNHPVFGTNPRQQTKPCTLVLREIEFDRNKPTPSTPDFSWDCIVDPADADGVGDIIVQLKGLNLPRAAKDNSNRPLESGVSTLQVPGLTYNLGNGIAKVPSGITPNYGRRAEQNPNMKRRLAAITGQKSVLVVRVLASGGATSASEDQLSDSVFGTSGDAMNLASQMKACSHDKLNFNPTTDSNISNGVTTVTVSVSTSQGDGTMNSAIGTALQNKFGKSASSLADHVMYCLPPGTMSGIAYAYVNSWLSVYSDNWCTYPSAQMHEVGHNIGLAHAGEGDATYADQSGMMGYSYSQDDGPKMCFNAAKSWQLGWFEGKMLEISRTSHPNGWGGDIVGQALYSSSSHNVLLKLNTGSAEDYYIMFNHKTGYNDGTLEGGNQVTVVRAGGEGSSYAASTLVAKLNAGGQYTIANFDGSGVAWRIRVNSISTDPSTGKANISVEPDTTLPPTPSPTPPPTPSPTPPPPTPSPTTGPPTPSPTPGPTPPPTPAPTANCSAITRKSDCNNVLPLGTCGWEGNPNSGNCKSLSVTPNNGPVSDPSPTQAPGPAPAPNCSSITSGGTCRNAGCSWSKGTCS